MTKEFLDIDDHFDEPFDDDNYHQIEVLCCNMEMEEISFEEYEYGNNEYYIELECKICGMKATLIIEPPEEKEEKEDDDFDWTRPEFFQEELDDNKK